MANIPFSIFRILEITLAAVAGMVLLTAGSSLNEFMLHKSWAKEVGLTITAAQMLPGNLKYEVYSSLKNIDDLPMSITKGEVRVGSSIQEFPIDRGNPPKIIHRTGGRTVITKIAGDLTVLDKGISTNLQKMKCPDAKGRLGKVMVDPGNATARIAALLPYDSTSAEASTEDRLRATRNARTVVSLRVKKEDPAENNIVAFINDNSANKEESERLACLIVNRLTQLLGFHSKGRTIAYVNLNHLSKDDPRQILQAPIAAYVELGNVNYPQNLIRQPLNTTTAILEALREYE